MPELPEVEVVRRGLAEHILGAEFQHTDVLHPRAVRGQNGGAAAIAAGLSGARVADVRRRGKYLWLELAERETSWCTWACPARCCWGSRVRLSHRTCGSGRGW